MITLDVPPDLLREIESSAKASGTTVEEALLDAAREKYGPNSPRGSESRGPVPTISGNGGRHYAVSREEIEAMIFDDRNPDYRQTA